MCKSYLFIHVPNVNHSEQRNRVNVYNINLYTNPSQHIHINFILHRHKRNIAYNNYSYLQ